MKRCFILLVFSSMLVLSGCGGSVDESTSTPIEQRPGYIEIVKPSESNGFDYSQFDKPTATESPKETPSATVEPSKEVEPTQPEVTEQPEESGGIVFDPTPVVIDGVKDGFADVINTISEYKKYLVSEVNYESESIMSTMPEWVLNNYIFYPDEWEDVFCYAVSVDMCGSDVSFEQSERVSYYHYNGSDYCKTYSVNGVDMCFVFCEDSSVVYVYNIDLER